MRWSTPDSCKLAGAGVEPAAYTSDNPQSRRPDCAGKGWARARRNAACCSAIELPDQYLVVWASRRMPGQFKGDNRHTSAHIVAGAGLEPATQKPDNPHPIGPVCGRWTFLRSPPPGVEIGQGIRYGKGVLPRWRGSTPLFCATVCATLPRDSCYRCVGKWLSVGWVNLQLVTDGLRPTQIFNCCVWGQSKSPGLEAGARSQRKESVC